MKKKFYFSLLFLAVLFSLFSRCTRTIINRNTQLQDTTKEEEFRCRINGNVYPPSSSGQISQGVCFYQPEYSGGNGWVFSIAGDRQQVECRTFSVSITLDSILLERGKTYSLGTEGKQSNFGTYYLANTCSQEADELYTKDSDPGHITITEFNPYNKIVSGTFSFTVVDGRGNEYQITNGVFHRHYTN